MVVVCNSEAEICSTDSLGLLTGSSFRRNIADLDKRHCHHLKCLQIFVGIVDIVLVSCRFEIDLEILPLRLTPVGSR
jgi:hypothetical protein